MTSLDTYIEMIGKTIVAYCNGQLYRSGKPQQNESILEIDAKEGEDKDTVLRQIDELKGRLLSLIMTSLATRNPQRQFHLFYFLDKYIFFKKALISCDSYTEVGWKDFISQLETFITNCYVLDSNTAVTVSVPIHPDITIKGKAPKTSDDGKQHIVELKGLNCQSGSTWKPSDLGEIVHESLIQTTSPILLAQMLTDIHRIHLQLSKSSEQDKKIKELEGDLEGLGSEHDALEQKYITLQEKVDAQAEMLEKMSTLLKSVEGRQKTISIMSGPSFFNTKKTAEKREDVVAATIDKPKVELLAQTEAEQVAP